ncbi:MAG: nucleotidyltransferase domain-containing protein [Egibacteraceae bacterium]
MTTPAQVVARRREQRRQLLDLARAYLTRLDPDLGIAAAVVVGSVARGDFHHASDVDIVVVARRLPPDPDQRWQLVAPPGGIVQPVAWTPDEWRQARQRNNPLVIDALDHGAWLVGSLDALD